MTTQGVRSRLTGFFTCCAAIGAGVSLDFSRSVLEGMLQGSRAGHTNLSRLAVFALAVTSPTVLAVLVVTVIVLVAASEVVGRTEGIRQLVQITILIFFVALLTVALSGFFISFSIPNVHIQ